MAWQAGTTNCAIDDNSTLGIGVLSASSSVKDGTFPATAGHDLATGFGSVNITNLIVNY